MALDPRLASVELLALAAMRAKQRQAELPPTQAVVLQIEYDAYEDEPPLLGERYTLYLPAKAPSIETWERVVKARWPQYGGAA